MTDIVLNDLVDEFRIMYPQAETTLRANVKIWQNKMTLIGRSG
jgi:hypothetical protein